MVIVHSPYSSIEILSTSFLLLSMYSERGAEGKDLEDVFENKHDHIILKQSHINKYCKIIKFKTSSSMERTRM